MIASGNKVHKRTCASCARGRGGGWAPRAGRGCGVSAASWVVQHCRREGAGSFIVAWIFAWSTTATIPPAPFDACGG
eukprot:264750-Chlamydomonas_euryale.AAC.9